MIVIKSKKEIKKMRAAGHLAARLLDFLEQFIKPGISTQFINDKAEEFTKKHKATSAPLGYYGFPKSICTSINNVVCHGIPDEKDILKNGDIINIDVTPILDGYHGDSSRTFTVGEVSEETRLLVERTKIAMMKGIEIIAPGNIMYEIGLAIENYISPFGYSIVREYTGHGIGKDFHEDPQVLHHYSKANDIKFMPGMTFTVEPMINLGKKWRVKTSKDDGWTVTTSDGSLSAQFEHTILVTEEGYEILTL